MLLSRKRKSALLVDFDNVVRSTGVLLADAIGNWLAWLEDGGFDPKDVRRDFLVKRVYWNVDNDTVHRLKFKKHKFETRLCRAVRNKDKGSSADFDITIDAVELFHGQPRLEEVVILSFDSDFLTVLNHLQVNDIEVVGMAKGDDRPAQAYREMADYVIEHEALVGAFGYERESRSVLAFPRDGSKRPLAEHRATAEAPKPKGATRAKCREPAQGAAPSAAIPAPSAPRSAAPDSVERPATEAAVAAPAKKNAAKRARRSAAKKQANARLAPAAEAVALAAASSPSRRLSKKFVCRTLENFDGFRTTGREPWLGCANYPTMIKKVAALHPALEMVAQGNGGYLAYRGPQTPLNSA